MTMLFFKPLANTSLNLALLLCLLNFFTFSRASASGIDCDDPNAVAIGTADLDMDGFYMGANHCLYDPELVSPDDILPVSNQYNTGLEVIFAINGANTTSTENDIRLRSLAQTKQRPVIGIFNAPTWDNMKETLKLIDVKNNASVTLHKTALNNILADREFYGLGMSQSGFIVARGLRLLKADLHKRFPLNRKYRRTLLAKINIETVGAIGLTYPNGPNYVHYVNMRDRAPLTLGVMALGAHPGRGAVIGTFYYEDENCFFGMLPLTKYPSEDAELSTDLPAIMGRPSVHGLCSYASSGMPYEYLRSFAPHRGHAVAPIDIE
ncbi:MAG: hypothetical protein KUG80_02955 [Gammaproteobacteria bacterium]|nr:hypothetical protein [Gammaproteobacteria bacterium]